MPAELGETDSTVSLRYTTVNNSYGQSYAELEPVPHQARVLWPLLFYMFILAAERTEVFGPWQKW